MIENLDIIIVNYNTADNVLHCIDSFKKNKRHIKSNIIIVDNNSTDESIKNNNFYSREVKFLSLNANLGFAKANNIGVQNSDTEYICFLNPDTIVLEDFITPIIDYIKSNDNAGACAPMLVYENNSYQASSGFSMGFFYEFMEAFMLIGIYRKIKEMSYKKKAKANKPIKVGWVSAACLVIKKSVFNKVGGFTEDFFLNYEDIDLCKKLENHGFENYYFPHLKCVHLDHKSFDKNYELLVYSRYQSRLIYSKLHYNMFLSLIVRFMHILGLLLRLIFVNVSYSGTERIGRKNGYKKSMSLYLNFSNKSGQFA